MIKSSENGLLAGKEKINADIRKFWFSKRQKGEKMLIKTKKNREG